MSKSMKSEDSRRPYWVFDAEVADIFDTHVRQSIPFYDEIHRMVTELSDWFICENSLVYDLGTSTGYAIANLWKRHSGENVRFCGIDSSDSMIRKATERCRNMDGVTFVKEKIEDMELQPSDLVLMLFLLQFIPINKRRTVISKAFRCLNEGGALIVAEKVISEDALSEDIFRELYEEMKEREGLNTEEIRTKRQSLRGVLQPLTLNAYQRMLRDCGFNPVETFFKWYDFAGILAIKAPDKTDMNLV